MSHPPTFQSLDEAFLHTLRSVTEEGFLVSPRGAKTRELIGWSFRIADPRLRCINVPARRWSLGLAVGELCWHLTGSDDVRILSYYTRGWMQFSADGIVVPGSCYGKRIFASSPGQANQWESARLLLRSDSDSRRAVLLLSDPLVDEFRTSIDVPCLQSIQFFIRDARLHCIGTMRSNDVMLGMGYDIFLITMLQELMACELGLEVGWYQHVCGSVHLYEHHWSFAEGILKATGEVGSEPMPRMQQPGALSQFLELEKQLREGSSDSLGKVSTLPSYWKYLAQPLLKLHHRRWESVSDRPITVT